MKLFLSPHNDDETLFGAFTLLRERPLVLIVFDGYLQAARGTGITAEQRRNESRAAMEILGCTVEFMGLRDDNPNVTPALIRAYVESLKPTEIYAPAREESGHRQHNLAADAVSGMPNVRHYMTYTPAGKSTGVPVPYEPEWPLLKLKALACYESQIKLWSTKDHFLRDQYEYTLE